MTLGVTGVEAILVSSRIETSFYSDIVPGPRTDMGFQGRGPEHYPLCAIDSGLLLRNITQTVLK